jgi:hypothetical protein
MAYTIQNIIDRARIYVDDNHKTTDGWKQPADWLDLAKSELVAIYRKWVRESIISFSPISGLFTGPSFTFPTTPLAIIGVAQTIGTQVRVIPSAMSQFGRQPFWDDAVTVPNNTGTTWTAAADVFPDGDGDIQYTLTLHPPDTADGYQVKYIRFPEFNALDKFVILPEGYEDYVALRLAKKALASEGASSQAIERLLISAEAEIKMDSFSNVQGDGPKVRIVRPFSRQLFFSNKVAWPFSPSLWFFP